MKKIEFGYSNDIEPNGSWEGKGLKQSLLLTEADYYGVVECDGNSYLISKVTDDKYNNYPYLVNKFIVRGAIIDMYADGSSILFLDGIQSIPAERIERFLNMKQIKDKICCIDDVFTYIQGLNRCNKFFKLLEMEDKILATTINHNIFESKNEAIKNCKQTFSDLQRSIVTKTKRYSR